MFSLCQCGYVTACSLQTMLLRTLRLVNGCVHIFQCPLIYVMSTSHVYHFVFAALCGKIVSFSQQLLDTEQHLDLQPDELLLAKTER